MMHATRIANRRLRLLAVATGLCAAVSLAPAAEPEVLSRIPSDAYAMIVVNNVRTLSNRVSNAATRLNIPIPPDLVGYATRNLGITKGFDANSSAALVLLKPAPDRQGESYFSGEPPMVMLLPTLDAKGMLEPFQPTEADSSGIIEVTLPQNPGEKGYAATVEGKWVALSQTRADLAAYLARTDSFAAKASADVRKVFDRNDLVVWGNVPKLGAGVDKMLDDVQTDFSGRLDLMSVTANQDPFAGAMQRQMVGMGFAFMKEFLKDANSSMLTLRLTESGATLGMIGEFKAESAIGKFVASQQDHAVTLKGLPSPTGSGFLAAGSFSFDGASMAKVMGDFSEQLFADDTLAKDPRAADMKKAFEKSKDLFALMTGARFIVLDPPAGGKTGFINGVAIIDTTDAEKFKQLQLESMRSPMMQQSMNPDFKQTVAVVPNAVTIKGVQLTKMSVKLELRDETPEKPLSPMSRMSIGAIQKVYGPDGMTVYLGVVGTKALVIYGSDGPTLEAAVTAAQADKDTLSSNPTIVATKDQLVPNAIGMAYLPVTRWMTLVQEVMRPAAAGAELPPPSPVIANAPPVVFSAGATGSIMTAEVHVPIATIQGIQEAAQRLQRAMMGGGDMIPPPGAPGGGGPLP